MTDRGAQIDHFLQGTAWAQWRKSTIAGDASARRYYRLTAGHQSVILMDADPATGQDTQPFATIGAWLSATGLCAPETLKHDPKNGLMIITDLGPNDMAQHLHAHPMQTELLYTGAIDVLIKLNAATPPPNLTTMSPEVGGEMVEITTQWYTKGDGQTLAAEVTDHLHEHCGPANKVALRDFHAENLIWRPAQTGTDRIGLLDYQDAFVAPTGYDLVSLLRDVRRNVDPTLAAAMKTHFNKATGAVKTDAAFACLAVQRNLRILGVFARLAIRDGKTRYMSMIPHIWNMLTEDLSHPALTRLQTCVFDILPHPKNSIIKGLL